MMRAWLWGFGLLALGCMRMTEQVDHFACTEETDCPDGESCFAAMNAENDENRGLCAVRGTDCVTNADCNGSTCLGVEAPSYSKLGVFGTCDGIDRASAGPCKNDAACDPGDECVLMTGECTPADQPCRTESDCVTGQRCGSWGKCITIECTTNADCFPYRCDVDYGTCQDSCLWDDECANGASCNSSACTAD